MFVCVGCGIQRVAEIAVRRGLWNWLLVRTAATVLVLLMVPGSGVRTLVVHLQHWKDINYDSPRFARRLMDSLPPTAVCAVDTQFALDFVAAGRPTLLAQTLPTYFRLDQFDYDYLIVSRYGNDTQIADALRARLLRTDGIQRDRFACYAEIYKPPAETHEEH
jgi:hypothetical protein